MIDICLRCRRERLIYCKGLCFSCYNVLQSQKNPEKAIERQRRWQMKNRAYWRDYQRKKRKIPKKKWRVKESFK